MDLRRWVAAARAWLRPIVRSRVAARDLDDELSFHVAMQAAANRKQGMSDAEAQRRARLGIGGLEQAKERTRDARPLHWLETTSQDVRYALRSLRRTPGFTAVAVITLALGIGANTAIFSMVSGVLLRPLPYPKPSQLMYFTTQFPELGLLEFRVSAPEYFEFRDLNHSFAEVGAYATAEVTLTGGDRPRSARAALVDDHLLNALGLRAAQGRIFGPRETDITGQQAPGGPPPPPPAVALLSDDLWRTAFGGRPMAGEFIEVDGRRVQVIGVMEPGADLMDRHTEIWLPIGLNPVSRGNRSAHNVFLIGRLKDGVTPQRAQAELDALIATWPARAGLPPNTHSFVPLNRRRGHILQFKPLERAILGSAGRSIWVLQAAVALVLLIACANLANLLLARAETRRREFAVRTALGAGRGRLLRQFVTEGVLLSFAGGALGILLARAGLQALLRAYPSSWPRTGEVRLDPIVLVFTFVLATATGVLFGLAPLLHTRVRSLAHALRDGGSKGARSSARRRVRSGLVVAEVALAVMLVIGAGLLVRSVVNLIDVDAGFDRSRLVTFSMTLPPAHYRLPSARIQMYQQLLEKLRAVPGVLSATAMSGLPPSRPLASVDTTFEGYTYEPGRPVSNVEYYQNVMTDYFETMGIPLVAGRGFERGDIGATGLVAVVNETLVDTFWKGQNAIGKRVRVCCNEQFPWFTVVGVAKDVRQGGVDQHAGTELYFFVDQTGARPPGPGLNLAGFGGMNVVMRTTLVAAALAQAIERVVHEMDPAVPLVRFREMNAVFDESMSRPRLLAQLVGTFAGLALLLAAVGTYGVLAYTVTEQRREIGIRLALGADRGRVLAGVMKHGLALTSIGLALGVAGAFGLTRLIASLLFGVKPTDAATFAAAVPAVVAVAAIACGLPAWRASRLDPGVVLRDE